MNLKVTGTLLATLAVGVGVYLGVTLVKTVIPDVQRYMRIRAM